MIVPNIFKFHMTNSPKTQKNVSRFFSFFQNTKKKITNFWTPPRRPNNDVTFRGFWGKRTPLCSVERVCLRSLIRWTVVVCHTLFCCLFLFLIRIIIKILVSCVLLLSPHRHRKNTSFCRPLGPLTKHLPYIQVAPVCTAVFRQFSHFFTLFCIGIAGKKVKSSKSDSPE